MADANFRDKLADPDCVPGVILLTSIHPPNTVTDKRFMSAIEAVEKGAILPTIFRGWLALRCFVVHAASIHIYTPKYSPPRVIPGGGRIN